MKKVFRILAIFIIAFGLYRLFLSDNPKPIVKKKKTPHFFSPNIKFSNKKRAIPSKKQNQNDLFREEDPSSEEDVFSSCGEIKNPFSGINEEELSLNDLYEVGDNLADYDDNIECSHVLSFIYLRLADLVFNLNDISSFEDYIGKSLYAIQNKSDLEFVEKWVYRIDSPEAIDTINDVIFEISLIREGEQDLLDAEEEVDFLLEELTDLYTNSLIDEFEENQGEIFEL